MSGYVYRDTLDFKKHMVKKFKGLFVPWFIFSNFNIILSSIVTLKGDRNLKDELILNLFQIRGYGDGIWFVAALFMAFIPFYFVVKLNNCLASISLSFVLALLSNIYSNYFPKDYFSWGSNALPWHLEYIFIAMFWMVLGFYYKQQFEKAFVRYDKWYLTTLVSFIYLAVVFSPIYVKQPFIAIVFTYARSLLGVVFLVLLSKRIKSNAYFSYVGANTLIYFAFHGKVYAVIEKMLATFMSSAYNVCLSNTVYSSLTAVLITLLLSVILIIPAYCINRWLPWIVGREKR